MPTAPYSPLRVRSAFSIQRSTMRPWQIPLACHQVGAGAAGVVDLGSMSGLPAVLKAAKDACKHCGYPSDRHAEGGKGACVVKGVACGGYEPGSFRPLLGSDFWVTAHAATNKDESNRRLARTAVLAKGLPGWKALLKATTAANQPDRFDTKPRLSLEELAGFGAGSWMVLTGAAGTPLADACFLDPDAAYAARTKADAQALLKPQGDLKKAIRAVAGRYAELFGKDNLVLEVGLMDAENVPAAGLAATAVRWLAKQDGYRVVAAPDVYYPGPDDAADQRVMVANSEDVDLPLEEVHKRLGRGEFVAHQQFFRSRNYGLPSGQAMLDMGHLADEMKTTLAVAEACETAKIFGKPIMPVFDCPGGKAPDEYLRELCREGWQKKIQGKIPKSREATYADRVKHELEVFAKANLSSYFLVTQDFIRYAHKELGCWPSRGRGSAAGCLVSHLLDITNCDPIRYDLSFERFYDDSRNDPAKGDFTVPDIDSDFPPDRRDLVIDYVRRKYGGDRVAHLATFAELGGREGLTAVLRAHGWGTFEERKAITKLFPEKAKVADGLQEMMEEEGEGSLIAWTLKHRAKDLGDYVTVREDGTLDGPLARHFEQAIRLEGVKKAQGRHPSAIVILPCPLDEVVPLVHDKNSEHLVIGMDMHASESMGVPKFDFLGLAALQKLESASRFARYE